MRFALVWSFCGALSLAPLALAAQQPAKTTTKSSAKPQSTSKSSSKAKSKSSAKSKTKAKQTSTVKATQQHPTTDRYKEIQQALIERGYMKEATGTWGPESVAALQRFQTDVNIPADGKISALSLSALGLGPRSNKLGVPVAEQAAGSAEPVEQ